MEIDHTVDQTGGISPCPEAESPTGHKLEVHVNLDEAHFHDRTAKLKVAVPIAEWYAAWKRLRSPHGTATWSYYDRTNQTLLMISSYADFISPDQMQMVAGVSIKKVVNHTSVYTALENSFQRANTERK